MSSSRTVSDRESASVSAVVLTIGEATTERAIASVNRQTAPVAETIIVRDETPFHRALNVGAAQVKTAFFVQVDADMELESDCLERLLACAHDNVGEVAGYLRDPLLGQACCIKLYRTACFGGHALGNTISPDTDFERDLEAQGYTTVYAVRFDQADAEFRHTFGRHDPEYSIDYTFRKHLIDGRRYVYRANYQSYRWHVKQLEKQPSDVALAAQIALAHGLFLDGVNDQLVPYGDGDDQQILQSYKRLWDRRHPGAANLLAPILAFSLSPEGVFERYYRLGVALGQCGLPAAAKEWIGAIDRRNTPYRLIGKTAFCHGLLQPPGAAADARRKRDSLRAFVGHRWPSISLPMVLINRIAEVAAACRLFYRRR